MKRLWLSTILCLAILGIGWLTWLATRPAPSPPTYPPQTAKSPTMADFDTEMQTYFFHHNLAEVDCALLPNHLLSLQREIDEIVDRHQTTNGTTGIIHSMQIVVESPDAPRKEIVGYTGVRFVANREDISVYMLYAPEFNAVLFRPVEWPPKLFAGFLLHELGHAAYFHQGRPSSTAKQDSDAYIDEEIEMYVTQSAVWNAETGGQLQILVANFLTKRNPANWKEAILGATADEFLAIDECLGVKRLSGQMAHVTCPHYAMMYGLVWINRFQREAWEQETRALYRFTFHDLKEGISSTDHR